MKDSEGGEKEGKYYRLFQDIGFLLIFRKLSLCRKEMKKEKWFLFFSNEKKAFLELLLF